jgi:hypothetical protein
VANISIISDEEEQDQPPLRFIILPSLRRIEMVPGRKMILPTGYWPVTLINCDPVWFGYLDTWNKVGKPMAQTP